MAALLTEELAHDDAERNALLAGGLGKIVNDIQKQKESVIWQRPVAVARCMAPCPRPAVLAPAVPPHALSNCLWLRALLLIFGVPSSGGENVMAAPAFTHCSDSVDFSPCHMWTLQQQHLHQSPSAQLAKAA